MKIIKNRKIYPEDETPLKEHFSEFTDVFIGLIPFFKNNNQRTGPKSSKEILTLEQVQEKDDLFKKIDSLNGDIYSTNEDYPKEEEILKSGEEISWSQIIEGTTIQDFRELNKALMTSIGSYREKLRRDDVLDTLTAYTELNNIWHPTEGAYGVFVKKGIYDILKSQNIYNIKVQNEQYEKLREVDLTKISKSEFVIQTEFKDYFIYSEDESILFSISWDYFFFFVAIDRTKISNKLIESRFEGFWAKQTDSHLWTWDKGEIERLLSQTAKKKSWWKRMIC